MNHSQQYHYKGMDADLDELLTEYKNQTPLESDHYAGECRNYISKCNRPSRNRLHRAASFLSSETSQKIIT